MDIYLHVHLTVAQSDMEEFSRAVRAFLDAGLLEKEFGWRLVAAMQVIDQDFPTEPLRRPLATPHANEHTFINIWKLRNDQSAAQIPEIMLRLSEDPTYVDLDGAVVDESQDIVYRVNQALDDEYRPTTNEEAVATALHKHKRVAFVRHYLDRSKLAEYVVNFAALAPKWAAEMKGQYAGTYQNITGLLNEFWDVWGMAGDGLQSVRTTFRNLIDKENGEIVKLYKDSIDYDKRDTRIKYTTETKSTDDGLVIAAPAFYWKRS